MASKAMSEEEVAAQAAKDKEVAQWVEDGQTAVSKHNLKQAEDLLLKAWSGLRPDAPDADRLFFRVLISLAEVYVKRARVSKEELESYWKFLKSLTLQKMAIKICDKMLNKSDIDNELCEWFKEQREPACKKCRLYEGTIVRLMYNRVKYFDQLKEKQESGSCESIIDMWMNSLIIYCRDKLEDMNTAMEEIDQDTETTETDSSVSDKDDIESDQKDDESMPLPKIEFETLQSTIQSLIRKMTLESKQQHLKDLKKEIADNREKSEKEEIENKIVETIIPKGIMIHRTPTKSTPDSSSDTKHDKNTQSPQSQSPDKKSTISSEVMRRKKEMQSKKNVSFVTQSPKAVRPTQLITPPVHREVLRAKPEPDYQEKDDNPNIIRIWKGYKNKSDPDVFPQFAPHRLNNFEEFSPITEAFRFQPETQYVEENENSPIQEAEFKSVLGETIAKVADNFFNQDKFENALRLYTVSLGIFQTVPEQTSSMVCMGLVLKHIGMVKCKLGDVIGGCKLMEKAIDVFEKYPDHYSTVNIAKVWYELGLAYMDDQWDTESLFEHVTEVIHSELDDLQIFKSEQPEYPSETDSEGDSESNEESYSVCTKEAITCFTHTYELLKEARSLPDHEQQYTDLYAEVLTKLGDCSIMVGNYDLAVNLYEEALKLFKVSMGSTNIVENAHVLSMLGVANFLLKHYPLAAMILECAYLMQHTLYASEEDATFEVAFTLTMLAVSFYMSGKYHRCVQWCIKANNLYTYMFEDKMDEVEESKRWFIIQTMYVLGFSYGTLNFYEKSIFQLKSARELCLKSRPLDRKQIVRIVKCLADVYSSMEDNDSALVYYNEALEYNIGFDEEDAAVLQNQLLNRTAGVHVNMKQYSTAARYLEQALDVQKNLEDDIKGDLVTVLYQLGQTYALAGDIDKAMECYVECLDDYKEEHGQWTSVMCPTLVNLATLCHVKGCLEESDNCYTLIEKAKSYFLEALTLDNTANNSTLYANYLYCQGEVADALYVLLPFLQSDDFGTVREIAFMGVELAILPEHIQPEIDELEEVFFESNILAKFLAFLCYRQLNMTQEMDDVLISLYQDVLQVEKAPLPYCMMGYAFLELRMFEEAAECFGAAAAMYDNDRSVAYSNYWVSTFVHVYVTLMKSLEALLELADVKELPVMRYHASNEEQQTGTRDSGYYENKDMQMWPSSETVASRQSESDYHTQEEGSTGSLQQTKHLRSTPNHLPLTHRTTDDQGHPGFLEKSQSLSNLEKSRSLPFSIDSSSQEFDSWVFSSTETLETPDQNYIRNLTNMSFLDGDDMLSSCTTDEDEWTITEETVDTPAVLLSSLNRRDSKSYRDEKKAKDNHGIHTVVETVNRPMVWTSRMPDENNKTAKDALSSGRTTPEEEEWTVYEETVEETPNAILQAITEPKQVESSEEVREPSEMTTVEEVVVETPLAILQALHGSGERVGFGVRATNDNDYDSNKHESCSQDNDVNEWTVSEEVVETPTEILMTLQNRKTESQEIREYEENVHQQFEASNDANQQWVVYEEETVETPSTVLKALITGSEERLTNQDDLQRETYYNEQSYVKDNATEEEDIEEESWTVTEEVVETPAAVLQTLIGLNKGGIGNREGEWIRIEQEQVIEAPAYLLQSLSRSQTQLDQSDLYDERPSTPAEEWTVTEEVVDTPSSVLQALIMRSQLGGADKQSVISTTERSLTSHSDLNNSKSQELYDITRHSPDCDARSDHTVEWIVTEESVDTPLEILQALQRQSASSVSLMSPMSDDRAMHTASSSSPDDEDGDGRADEWVTEEIVAETPSVILQALRTGSVSPSEHGEQGTHARSYNTNHDSQSQHSTTNTGHTGSVTGESSDVYAEFDKTYNEMTNSSPYRSMDNQSLSTMQDTIVMGTRTPEGLSTIKNNNYTNNCRDNRYMTTSPRRDVDRTVTNDDDDQMTTITWVTEEVVSTPLEILQALAQQQQQQQHTSGQQSLIRVSLPQEQMIPFTSSPDEEVEEESWTTFEETTVETPAAIIALISK